MWWLMAGGGSAAVLVGLWRPRQRAPEPTLVAP